VGEFCSKILLEYHFSFSDDTTQNFTVKYKEVIRNKYCIAIFLCCHFFISVKMLLLTFSKLQKKIIEIHSTQRKVRYKNPPVFIPNNCAISRAYFWRSKKASLVLASRAPGEDTLKSGRRVSKSIGPPTTPPQRPPPHKGPLPHDVALSLADARLAQGLAHRLARCSPPPPPPSNRPTGHSGPGRQQPGRIPEAPHK